MDGSGGDHGKASWVVVKEKQPQLPVATESLANTEVASFAEVLRGAEKTSKEERQEKKLVTSLAFTGGESGWKKVYSNLEVARNWVRSCENMEVL